MLARVNDARSSLWGLICVKSRKTLREIEQPEPDWPRAVS
jgi:hypothetical protein